LVRKPAADIAPGDFVWCFAVETYSPNLAGHYRFIRVDEPPNRETKPTSRWRWFNQQDGPETWVPDDWLFFSPDGLIPGAGRRRVEGYAHAGHLVDLIPLAVDLELFSDAFTSRGLSEAAAYFLGAFALRPQCYAVGDDTWGVFGVHFNRAGRFGITTLDRTTAQAWFTKHREAFESLANEVWGSGGFHVEQRGATIGLANLAPPVGHRRDQLFSAAIPVGFAIHAPIAIGKQLDVDGSATSADLRIIQYWYACLVAHLVERSSESVRKAFLLGAADTVSNADSDRHSIGLDFLEGYVGEFPMYSAIHAAGRSVLDTFEVGETTNPRATPTRTRGRIPRFKIWEGVQEIGFISSLRFARALQYEPAVASVPAAGFPAANTLSVALRVPVQSVQLPTGYGSSERDLTQRALFRLGTSTPREWLKLSVVDENVFAASSLPLGARVAPAPTVASPATTGHLRLARAGWEAEALEKLHALNIVLGPWTGPGVVPETDRTFEYLIGCLMSRLEGCLEAWVLPRSEDQGVDVGATFSTGALDQLGGVTGIIQAKLQRQNVGRRVVDMLRGAMDREEGQIGWVVTTAGYSTAARRSADGDFPSIRLVNGPALVSMLVENEVGFFSRRSGSTRRTYIDLTFFERLRALAAEGRPRRGRIRVRLDAAGMPAFQIA
jgi:hypothetical protein